MLATVARPGLRRFFMTAVLRNEGDVVKGGGSFSKKERAIEDQYIHNKACTRADTHSHAHKHNNADARANGVVPQEVELAHKVANKDKAPADKAPAADKPPKAPKAAAPKKK
jgi:hypothetical protein